MASPLDNLLKKAIRAGAAASCAALAVAAGAAPPPSAETLARIVFPGTEGRLAGSVQTVALPGNGRGWGSGEPMRVVIDPRLALHSGADSITLIVAMVPADSDGKPAAFHPTPVALSAYRFRQAGAHWALMARQEGFAYQGFFGEADVRPLTLSERTQGLAVQTGSCWGGYCGSWVALYQLDDPSVAPRPVAALTVKGINSTSATDCAGRLRPLIGGDPADTRPDIDARPESHDCYAIESDWSIAPSANAVPGELTIHYRGAISRAASKPGPPERIDQRQVLRYTNGAYQVVSGTNPIPPI